MCAFALRNPHFRAFRAQNRGFCAFFGFGTPVFGSFEHKIEVFVRFCPPKPLFSGILSQNRHFCALLPASFFPMAPPASNKPHSAEKSTPVWLAIWRTWAGFANSQLLPDAATLSFMQGLQRSGNSSSQTSASLHGLPLLRHSKSFGPSAPIAYATCVSPPDEAAAWPGQVSDGK